MAALTQIKLHEHNPKRTPPIPPPDRGQSPSRRDGCPLFPQKLTSLSVWASIEDAIRARAKNRQARIAEIEKRVTTLREGNPVEVLRNRDPVDFLQWRADALAQRSADLKNSPVHGSRCIRL
jgi:hypothetical protein